MLIRLNRFLAECGVASRRNSEEYISEGRVTVNKKIVMDLATKIDPDVDKVHVDGELLRQEDKVYYLLNKPTGIITSTKDEKNRPTVVNLIKSRHKIFPIGRLDFNTTGTLLLTNDGDFSNLITHPKNKVPREYLVTLDKDLEKEDKEKLVQFVYLDKKKSKFIAISYPTRNNFKTVVVTCEEGRNHFVKRMFSLLGYTVKKLHRLSFAGISVGNLEAGHYREMSKSEIDKIKQNFS